MSAHLSPHRFLLTFPSAASLYSWAWLPLLNKENSFSTFPQPPYLDSLRDLRWKITTTDNNLVLQMVVTDQGFLSDKLNFFPSAKVFQKRWVTEGNMSGSVSFYTRKRNIKDNSFKKDRDKIQRQCAWNKSVNSRCCCNTERFTWRRSIYSGLLGVWSFISAWHITGK